MLRSVSQMEPDSQMVSPPKQKLTAETSNSDTCVLGKCALHGLHMTVLVVPTCQLPAARS